MFPAALYIARASYKYRYIWRNTMHDRQTGVDEKLVKKAQKGNTKAFATLYHRIYQDLYRFALYTVKHKEDAEDVVSNACFTAFQKIGQLKNAASFRPWMFQIAANECRMVFRRRNFRGEEALSESLAQPGRDEELTAAVSAALDVLSDEDRMIVLLSAFGGYTSAEIAEMMEIAPGTVRSRKSRAYDAMRPYLSEDGEDYDAGK